MLAASMALGNMTHAISMFSDGKGGLQRFTTKKHLLKIYGMVRHLPIPCSHAGRHGCPPKLSKRIKTVCSAPNACIS